MSVLVPVPSLTPHQRADGLSRAMAARRHRAEVKRRLKQGEALLDEVIEEGAHVDAVARLPVSELLEAMPGVGPAGAARIMDELGVAHSRRVRGLGEHQVRALIDHFARA